ncbi:MAG TPA: aldehyde ferredoxin oxidoreductase family protein [Anaerovoracaceae bacterium]|nr:aldehyde ferredoxin oxidoreductase family protein [Anaerovoracaceae bacterium]
MNYGYSGKILKINLSTSEISQEIVTEKMMRKYMGGKGLISYYLKRDIKGDIDAFSKDNKLYFMTGIMSGIPAAGTSRMIMGTKSPVTGAFGMSESGGYIATELKKAGWDGIIVEGKAKGPVYLNIEDNKVEIKDADHLWGKNIGYTNEMLKEELNDKRVKIAQIGIGGENQVLYACVINDLKHACGRCGIGAVMGSKNLKAVTVKGTGKINFKNPEGIKEISKWYASVFKDNPLSNGLYLYGTSGGVVPTSYSGILPTRNFRDGSFEKASEISGQHMAETILIKREGCFACPVRCKRVVKVDRKDFKVDPKFGGPEYETIGSMGSLCGIGDIEVIAKAHELCNDYGIDTISAGVCIAFAIECFEKNIIDEKITGGIKLEFGNEKVLLQLLEDIAYRRDFGKILSNGVKHMSELFGKDSSEFAMQVKGQELPMHDPRGKTGVALGYSVSPTGADHMQAGHDVLVAKEGFVLDEMKHFGLSHTIEPKEISKDKAEMYGILEKWWSFLNMAGVCFFIPAPRGSMPVLTLLKLLNFATGWDVTSEEALEIGKRGIDDARIFNYKFGVDEKEENLPERLHQPLENGALKGQCIDKEAFLDMKQEYFKYMDWDENGKVQENL